MSFTSHSAILESKSQLEITLREHKECRICLMSNAESDELMIAPCHCNGNLKYVHTQCLKQWILTSIRPKSTPEIELLQSNGIPCQICKQMLYFEYEEGLMCRSCDAIKERAHNRKDLLILLVVFGIIFLAAVVVCVIFALKSNTQMTLGIIMVSLTGMFTFSLAAIVAYTIFIFFLRWDIKITHLQLKIGSRRKAVGATTFDWRKKSQQVRVEDIS